MSSAGSVQRKWPPWKGEVIDRKTANGFVYFVQPEDGGLIKIGWAMDAKQRLRVLQAFCPIPLRILATTRGTSLLEAEIHGRFRGLRKHGEWFKPTPELLAFIEECRLATEAALAAEEAARPAREAAALEQRRVDYDAYYAKMAAEQGESEAQMCRILDPRP